MTAEEFKSLRGIAADIKRRQRELRHLDRLLEDGVPMLTDTVKSSTDAGSATVICHATVRGMDEAGQRLVDNAELLRAKLRGLQVRYNALYAEAVEMIERCGDPLLRVCLDAVYLYGDSFVGVADDLAEQGYTVTPDALRMQCKRWITENCK